MFMYIDVIYKRTHYHILILSRYINISIYKVTETKICMHFNFDNLPVHVVIMNWNISYLILFI